MIDIILLRTIFRGIGLGAYSPDVCLLCNLVSVWSTFSKNFLVRNYI